AGDAAPAKFRSPQDYPHHIAISAIYQLPFGRGRAVPARESRGPGHLRRLGSLLHLLLSERPPESLSGTCCLRPAPRTFRSPVLPEPRPNGSTSTPSTAFPRSNWPIT